MATIYISSAGSNTSPYDTLAKAATTFATAFAFGSAGDEFRVRDNHSETTSAILTLTSPGTSDIRCSLISIDASDTYSPASSAQIIVDVNDDITLVGAMDCYGISFKSGQDIWFNGGYWNLFDACTLELGTVGTGRLYSYHNDQQKPGIQIYNSEIKYNTNTPLEAMQITNSYLNAKFRNIAFSGANLPTTAFSQSENIRGYIIHVADTDLSAFTYKIFRNSTFYGATKVNFSKCKLGSGVILFPTITFGSGATISYESCDIGDGYHYFHYKNELGEWLEDTATYRNATIAKYDGTNQYSVEIVPNSPVSKTFPLEVDIYNGYIDTSQYTTTITFEVGFALEGTTTPLTTAELYIGVEYPDGADNALGVIATTQLDPLATGLNHTTETSAWTIAATNVQMKETITVTIGTTAGTIASGPIRVFVGVTKTLGASEYLFVDPGVVIS